MTLAAAFSTSIMDRTPESYRRPSAMVPPLLEDAHSLGASSNYLSPVSATTPQGPGYPLLGLVGLGISGLDDLRSFPSTVSYSMPPTMPTQLAPFDNLHDMALKVDDYTTTPYLSVYNSFPTAPHSPRRFYDSQAMSATPSFNSAMEASTAQSAFSGQMSGYWTPTPCSGPTSPLESVSALANSSMEDQWSHPYSSGTSIAVRPRAVPIGKSSYLSTTIAGGVTENGPKQPSNTTPTLSSPRNTTPGHQSLHEPQTRVEKARVSPKKQSQNEKTRGYACSLCGYRFTRRSNCMEHQKKHDPRSRESHPCGECNKTFGRKADLKRHTNNVSEADTDPRHWQAETDDKSRFTEAFANTSAIGAIVASVDQEPYTSKAFCRVRFSLLLIKMKL